MKILLFLCLLYSCTNKTENTLKQLAFLEGLSERQLSGKGKIFIDTVQTVYGDTRFYVSAYDTNNKLKYLVLRTKSDSGNTMSFITAYFSRDTISSRDRIYKMQYELFDTLLNYKTSIASLYILNDTIINYGDPKLIKKLYYREYDHFLHLRFQYRGY
jgi:hypothetical protein